ncbi:MAG TPA: DUF4199 domain-containing protein [Saprospiraceae bacterium]|nr:DUF4199 domain-containing protein [Saprospiraceae bacterium]
MQNTGVKWGLIGGALSVLISLLTYLIGPTMYIKLGSWLGFISILVVLALAGREERKNHGGYISFQELLRPIFLTFVIILVISTLMQVIMMKLIDPGLADIIKQTTIEGMEKLKGLMGDEAFDKAMEDINAKDFSGSLRDTGLGLAFNILFGFGLCALYAVIMKRKNPDLL